MTLILAASPADLLNEATIRANDDNSIISDLNTEILDRTNADIVLTNNLAPLISPQLKNTVYSGPVTGVAANPTFRLLLDPDVYSAHVPTGVFHAKLYGATGDGVTDDTVALENAIIAASVNGGTVFLSPGTYIITRSLFLNSNVSLVGLGRDTIITKRASVSSLLTINANIGDTQVTVANGALFAIGNGIHLTDTSSVDWAATPTYITNIAGNIITFNSPLNGNLQTVRSARVVTSFPLIRNIQGSSNVRVSNIVLDGNRNGTDPTGQFVLSLLHWVETYNSIVNTCWFRNSATDAYSDQSNNGTTTPLSQAAVKATRNVIINSYINDCLLYGIHFGTCQEGAIAANNIVTNCGNSGVHYSAYVQNTICIGNIISNCLNGFGELDERDIGNIITANTIKSCSAWGISSSSGAIVGPSLWLISNNRISDCTSGGILVQGSDCVITDNVIRMGTTGGEAIRVNTLADRCIISNNTIEGGGGGSTGIFVDSNDDVRILGNNIKGIANGMDIRGSTNTVIANNIATGIQTGRAIYFQVTTSSDVRITDNFFSGATPIVEAVAATRLVQNGMGSNGSTDPAVGGQWNGITGQKYNGVLVRWDNGAGVNTISAFWANAWMKIATT